jgi:putative Mn2+ efflux pump MntP
VKLLEILLIALALAMDAFAVACSKGAVIADFKKKDALTIGLYFGLFQLMMPLLGWLLGQQIAAFLQTFSHWVAFIILSIIGLKMLLESLDKSEKNALKTGKEELKVKTMVLLAVATSIDALAVGITVSILNGEILLAALVIGAVAFIISYLGAVLGKKFGALLKNKAELMGGLLLIAIAVKILVEGLT